jgi:hypothetical protein
MFLIKFLNENGPKLPPESKERIRNEIQKIQDAEEWVGEYKAGNNPSPPSWTRGYTDDLYRFSK